MSKQIFSDDRPGSPLSLDLDEEQIAALDILSSNLHPDLKCLIPVLDTIRQANGNVILPHRRNMPTRQATDFKSTTAAAQALGVEYKEHDISYVFNLKTEHLQDSTQLSEHFASMIKDIKTSEYASARHDESFCRTVLDLVIMDRLRHLKDKDVHRRLKVSAEVPISICIKDIYGNDEMLKGRADWALGYGATKSDTGAVLLVVEAKWYETAAIGMPQLLVYMAAVYEARKKRINQGIFGMLSDSKEFRFCFLDEDKKFFTTRPFTWIIEQPTIIAYIDMMLMNAIESSPHTTPQKTRNRVLNYNEFLGRQWRFGANLDDENTEDEKGDEDDDAEMVDVVHLEGRVILKKLVYRGRGNLQASHTT